MHHVTIVLLLDFASSFHLFIDFGEEVCLCVTVELPNVDAILTSSRNYLVIIAGIEHNVSDRVGVTDESLEVIWDGLLGLIIPHFDQIVVATGKHESSV